MYITLNVPSSPVFLLSNLHDDVRNDLATVDITQDKLTVTHVGDDAVTVAAVVFPGSDHVDLDDAEVQELAQSAIN